MKNKFNIIKNKFCAVAFFICILVLLILLGVTINKSEISSLDKTNQITFHYYEDKTGNLNLNGALNSFSAEDGPLNANGLLTFGNSKSTYWVRIPLNQLSNMKMKEYMLIYNPTVAKAVLYLPINQHGSTQYEALTSGWSFGDSKNDEGFTYPIFRINENTDFTKDAYLKLYSPFTQNYSIDFLSHSEYERVKRNSFLLYGILFGILFAMGIQNLFIYMELKEKANLYYFAYMIVMGLYQGCLLGIYNVWFPKYSALIMPNTVALSFASMLAAVLFFRNFFQTKNNFPGFEKWIKILVFFVITGLVLILFGNSALTNLYAHTFSILGGTILLILAIKAYQKGFQPAKLFIAGWVFMMVGLVISFFRNSGWISNNVITINITFIAVTIQSIWLSTALVKTTKLLMTENEMAIRQYYEAKEQAKSHELNFLQAQIKPHFLYNTLNIIVSLCRIDSEKARNLLLDLADYLHHSFDFYPEQKFVFMETELDCVKTFVRIEQARFPDKIQVFYEIDETREFMVPPLILQPLVENAIVHGIRQKKGSGTVTIRVKQDAENFIIEVEDDGAGMTEEQIQEVLSNQHYEGNGVGINNINERLIKMYGQGLRIESRPGKGTLVSFVIRRGDNYNVDCNTDR